jgi:hypothetical protein
MAAWLIAALSLMASSRQGGIPLVPGALDPFEKGGLELPGFLGGPDDKEKKRRRRRRALTQSDRNDIAFIAATISSAAAGKFAVQLATRSR